MKITLYLMTQKGFEVLKALISNKYAKYISEVIVGRDKNIDNDFADEIFSTCKLNNIKYYERTDRISIDSDYSIAISWRWLIKETKSRLIILHDSLLPRYRGFAPLVNALLNFESEIGVTAIFAVEEYDKGDIIFQSKTSIHYPIKISEAINLITKNYVDLSLRIFKYLSNGKELPSLLQKDEYATYSLWRDEEDYRINWNNSSRDILNSIYVLSSPYKGASTTVNGKNKIRILDAEIFPDVKIENRQPGKIIFIKDNKPVVVCGTGLLRILEAIDDETGKSVIPFSNFRIRFK
jgi:methionyl-tRNA formyltransferase